MSPETTNETTAPNHLEDMLKELDIFLPDRDTFLEGRKKYSIEHQDEIREVINGKNLHKNDETRLRYLSEMHLRCAYVFEIATKFLNEQTRNRIKLIVEDDKKSKRTPLKTIFDTDILLNLFQRQITDRKQLSIAINHESFVWIVNRLLKKKQRN
ncbi:MAG TPA: hypothetical protein VLH94_03140 [Spirochaetia bacterium]|nr:hypothetical protein [Spirochaetia bacterium]